MTAVTEAEVAAAGHIIFEAADGTFTQDGACRVARRALEAAARVPKADRAYREGWLVMDSKQDLVDEIERLRAALKDIEGRALQAEVYNGRRINATEAFGEIAEVARKADVV